jgi:hypothetical protein
MFYIIHTRVNIFLVPAPLIKKNMKWFVGFLIFWYKISSTMIFFSLFNCFISVEFIFYVINSFVRWKTLCINNLFLTFWFFDCAKFSYDTSYGLISLVLMNNMFLCGLLALSIISFKNKISYPFFWWIFVYL